MKDHHSYEKSFIGGSDIASLTVRTPGQVAALNFGEDGEYMAYIVDAECNIPDHYELTFSVDASEYYSSVWMWIYDDDGLSFKIKAPNGIRIYQSGRFGCIIQTI